jgi:hypothetical protein
MGYMGIGYQKWISSLRARKPFSRGKKAVHSNIGNSTSGTRSFSPGRYKKEPKVPIALKLVLWCIGISAVVLFYIIIRSAQIQNKSNAKIITTTINTSANKTNAYLLKNIKYHFTQKHFNTAKQDLKLLLKQEPNNKKARSIQLEIAYIEAKKSTSAEANLKYLTREYKLRYPLDTSTLPYLDSLYAIQ